MQETDNQLTGDELRIIRAESAANLSAYVGLLGALREQYGLIKDQLVFHDKMVVNDAHKSLNRVFKHFDKAGATDGKIYEDIVSSHMVVSGEVFKGIKEMLLNEV